MESHKSFLKKSCLREEIGQTQDKDEQVSVIKVLSQRHKNE